MKFSFYLEYVDSIVVVWDCIVCNVLNYLIFCLLMVFIVLLISIVFC